MMRLPIRCAGFVESVTDWMEGALTDDDRLVVEEHLAICPDCTEYLRQLRACTAMLRALEGELPGGPPPVAARAALLTELRRSRGRSE